MLKDEKIMTSGGIDLHTTPIGGGANNNWARVCDTCRSAPCTVYCRADSAYLCAGCDARIHAANRVASRHERVWVCEACERAPAAFLCKADAASLCSACDSDIHSANPLARRHHRVPILPIPGTLFGPASTDPGDSMMGPTGEDIDDDQGDHGSMDHNQEDEEEAASWLLLNKPVDEYLDLVEYSSCDQENQFGETFNSMSNNNHDQAEYGMTPAPKVYGAGDGEVPVQSGDSKDQLQLQLQLQLQQHQQQQQHKSFRMAMEYEASNAGYVYASSMTHSLSVSSMDVGVVPESSLSDVSITQRPPKGTIDLFSSPPIQMPTQLTPLDREARVLRYREKKKTRKFEKTIRYASRKAYAETRPRIKGRFAKRTDVEVEVDQMFTTPLMTDSSYGIVPSF